MQAAFPQYGHDKNLNKLQTSGLMDLWDCEPCLPVVARSLTWRQRCRECPHFYVFLVTRESLLEPGRSGVGKAEVNFFLFSLGSIRL